MPDDIVKRLRESDGFVTFEAGDGAPAIKADTDLMVDASIEIERLQAKCRLLEADLAFHVGWREEITRKLGDTDGG